MSDATPFILYRFFATDDSLLYVGLTINPGRRMEKHRAEKPWWNDVARIAIEHHESLTLLRAAERDAIKAEKPLHNIRMNGQPETSLPKAAAAAQKPVGLVGRWFHTWRPVAEDDHECVTKRGDRVLQWQGQVLEQIDEGFYLIQTYSWMDGGPYEQLLITTDSMAGWTFYSNHIEMIASLGCREWTGRGAERHECGGLAEYLTGRSGLGSSAVCDHCAGYYSDVQPIIWRDEIATLGPSTRVPHPLSEEGMRRR